RTGSAAAPEWWSRPVLHDRVADGEDVVDLQRSTDGIAVGDQLTQGGNDGAVSSLGRVEQKHEAVHGLQAGRLIHGGTSGVVMAGNRHSPKFALPPDGALRRRSASSGRRGTARSPNPGQRPVPPARTRSAGTVGSPAPCTTTAAPPDARPCGHGRRRS